MDDVRFGKTLRDRGNVVDVGRRLVAPALLAVAIGVEPVEAADPVGKVEGLESGELGAEGPLLDSEIVPGEKRRDQLGEPIPMHLTELAQGQNRRQEMGLRGDRELRVGVEHQTEQRRAGARDADDERERRLEARHHDQGSEAIRGPRESRWS